MNRVSAEDNEKLRGYHLARCRVERGCDDDEVLRLLHNHGVPWIEAKNFLAELRKTHNRRFRLRGILNFVLGIGILGFITFIMTHQELLKSDVPGRKPGGGLFEMFLIGAILLGLGLARLVMGGRGERSRGSW